MSSKANFKTTRTSIYPAPLTFPPQSSTHKHTMILLHGRGSNAATFAHPLMSTRLLSGLTFRETFPTTKFIFPTASMRRATFANRTPVTQWFDNAGLDDLDFRPETQIAGLRETTIYLHGLVNEAAEEVGSVNVVLGGLSLGACASLIAALTWNECQGGLAGVVCMAGRLPLIETLNIAMDVGDESHDKDGIVFEADENEMEQKTMLNQNQISPGRLAINALQDDLRLENANPTDKMTGLKPPVFLGHGTQDDKVPLQMGKQAAACLEQMDYDVTWREYSDLGHWYHEQELSDVVQFLREKCNFSS